MKKLLNKINEIMDDFSVKKKLLIFYVCCVLLPLAVTDSVILAILLQGEKKEQSYEMANIASAVQFDFSYMLDEAVTMAKNIYRNRTLNEFLDREYESGLDFYVASQSFINDSFYETSVGSNGINIVMYGDNETIVNGGHFYRLSAVKEEEWYRALKESGQDMILYAYYIGDKEPSATSQKRISLIRRLNYFKDDGCEKVVKIDFDYSTLVRRLTNLKYSMPVYVCSKDQILFSNAGHSGITQDFERLTGKEKIGYETAYEVYGESLRILVMKPENTIISQISQHMTLILFMIAVNILLPWLLTHIINRSFTSRLSEISEAFDGVEAESLKEIENICGKDEIGGLMRNYNRMVIRSQELIKTVYKDRLERQEMDIARQNAELLALHSQINPHFLFNVLESIRMHSILKKEEETAGMIERLAVLERQNVDWSSDFVRIQEELQFIEAYLELQKYRFGDRLSYEISAEPDCRAYLLPKLTLVTFAENACVHGVERKASHCWIYIRAYRKEDWLYLEVEDTGNGMEEEEVAVLTQKMESCDIETVKENEHVGMINACLRLKMVTENRAEFELESERGVGTFITIRVPLEMLDKGGMRT